MKTLHARPILFSAPMVRAILDNRKFQTRRVVKPQPRHEVKSCSNGWYERDPKASSSGNKTFGCPYGVPGDRLWVRETWGIQEGIVCCAAARPNIARGFDVEMGPKWTPVIHRAGRENYAWGMYGPPKWKPSIHMPRTACRITLEVAAVRVERLQEISEADAIEEGVEPSIYGWKDYLKRDLHLGEADASYASLWESINGPGSWEANPFVWVITFHRLTP